MINLTEEFTVIIDDTKYTCAPQEKNACVDAQSYKIKTVRDMLKSVKPDRLEYFLDDLRILFERYYELTKNGVEPELVDGFTWIDDGEHFSTQTVTIDTTGVSQEDVEELKKYYAAKVKEHNELNCTTVCGGGSENL